MLPRFLKENAPFHRARTAFLSGVNLDSNAAINVFVHSLFFKGV